MAWWNFIGDIFNGGKQVAEVFTENRENRGQRKHEETMADIDRDLASLQQFSAEFHQRQNRTWWDAFVDGLNRLPRPMLTIAVLGFFILAPLDPAKFLEIARAYELMPPGYWALISIIIGFYFGGRMQLKSQDMTIRKDANQALKELIAMRQEFRQLQDSEDSPESQAYENAVNRGERPIPNKVVADWLESKSIASRSTDNLATQ